LWYILNTYLTTRINDYIFFEYYKWDILNIKNINLIEINNKNDIFLFIKMYKYDYEVFKLILFLYWDLEYYMERSDYVKNSLTVDSIDSIFFKIKLGAELKTHYEKLNSQNSNYFWADIEIYGLLDKILEYDLFFNFEPMDQTKNYIKEYNKFNNKISYDEMVALRVKLYYLNKKIK